MRRYILGGDDVDTFKLSFDSAGDFEGTRDLIPTTLRKSRYYKPKKKNFEAIDALGECDDVLYIFQMKISGAKFPVPLLANEKLLAKWGKPRIENMSGQIGGYRKCVYVYVVPDVGWENSENFYKVVKMAENATGVMNLTNAHLQGQMRRAMKALSRIPEIPRRKLCR